MKIRQDRGSSAQDRTVGLAGGAIRGSALAAIILVLSMAMPVANAQSYKPPRAPDGKPDLSGIWQTLDTSANWDIQPHSAEAGPVQRLGAAFAVPPGLGIVEGGEIPYLPAALEQKKANYQKRLTDDPEVKCYMPGVPRATYMPYPFQIVQTPKNIMVEYEYSDSLRTIYMEDPGPSPADSWMGWSVGHWEGDTLVVDVTGLIDQSWFDRAGDFHSDALHVVERYTRTSPETMNYEATIEDAKVFSRPWKINLTLYRHTEKNAQLLEYKCVPFAEPVLYGPFERRAAGGDASKSAGNE